MMIENDLFPRAESFGDRLRGLRRARGMAQSQLAEAMAVSCPTVSGWEKGRMHPRHDRLDALAAFLGVTTAYLVGNAPQIPFDPLAQSRQQIARIVGTTPDKVRILIEL